MLARLSRELPRDGALYEPKWDGFRCLAFRSPGSVDLRSRGGRPLGRYFPELVAALGAHAAGAFVLDGEIVVPASRGFDFTALLLRLHPARARVERLAAETPAWMVAFDLLALGSTDLRQLSFDDRRTRLEEFLRGVSPPLWLSPLTADPDVAGRWIEAYGGAGIDGVVAKARDLRYEPGKRAMVKVKPVRTARCVAAGARLLADRPLPSSLLLGLHDKAGGLQHVGLASGFSEARRRELLEQIRPLERAIQGHPWEHGFLLGGSPMGRLKGAAAGWTPTTRARDWIPLAPVACEVEYDHVDAHRLRHPARFRRWLPETPPASCVLDQFDPAPGDPRRLLAPA
jgi:ATP-dependent DNA ligase